ncbi:MAG: hypothetical protein SGILL_006953 [Bacillariaceae sp.]
MMNSRFLSFVLLCGTIVPCSGALGGVKQQIQTYNCSLPGLEDFEPGQYEGVTANYLSFVTSTSTPFFPVRAKEFEACTGGKIVFSEANNVWEDPIADLGTKTRTGSEIYDAYFMSYSHFPEVSELGLAEPLNDRIRKDNAKLKWEDIMPKVQQMGQYRKNGVSNIDFLMYDGDMLVPLIRIDLLEQYDIPMPNTWEEMVDVVKFFHGKDINDDGEPDYGLCHFPREGAGSWDWWVSELVYSTWATTDQLEGTEQGFLFDPDTLEPNVGPGLEHALNIWKDLWNNGASEKFTTGRCAVGYAPPGEWKGTFLNKVKREVDGEVVWQPTMQSGEYAEPYQLKTFGSTHVVHPETNEMVSCNEELCPKAEVIPSHGHHGDSDRASVLVASPLQGQLINRAPFYWSGGLGTLIRKSSEPEKKDLLWDYFVYTNSPETSLHDVATYQSWLDTWRFSQVGPGNEYRDAGWSANAFEEHKSIQIWGLSSNVNGAYNMRLPGSISYTHKALGTQFKLFRQDETNMDELKSKVYEEWTKISASQGVLDQIDIYRASLGLDVHTEVESCQLNRELMDEKDPSVCRKYDATDSDNAILIGVLSASLVLMFAIVVFVVVDQRQRKSLRENMADEFGERDEIIEVERLIYKDNRYIGLTRIGLMAAGVSATVGMTMWANTIRQDASEENEDASLYVYILPAVFVFLLLLFACFDWLNVRRTRKLVVNAAKTSEIVTTMFPGEFRGKMLEETRVVKAGNGGKEGSSQSQALAELFPEVTVFMADISGFTAWASVREPHQIFSFLEKVFGQFDAAAKKHKVFKVETIGDSYVACTGAPYAQKDHVENMCLFATEIMEQFTDELEELALQFGPNTTDLSLRCGLHSGVVTMGVLRNERARFQLFGDCVNTASRMESTSEAGKIQVSRESADLLIAAGYKEWLVPRSQSVVAKEKGVMGTFWLEINNETFTESCNSLGSPDERSVSVVSLQKDSLVDWNTESLLGLLKRIVAYRQQSRSSVLKVPPRKAFGLGSNQTFTDEVAEIIHLPKANIASQDLLVQAEMVEIDPQVVAELRLLVRHISKMYNDNPFHNFEHASHVTMSILKLLSRIVKPSSQEAGNLSDHSYGITADPLTHFACAFCGLIHDADHPGVSNAQFVKENAMLGKRFQGLSVAEQNSLNLCFQLLASHQFKHLRAVLFANDQDQLRFRQIVINSVMATDIFDPTLKALRNDRWNTAFSDSPRNEPASDTVNRKATIVIGESYFGCWHKFLKIYPLY